ncbi:MAG TPA: acetylxylan esterase [Armatimonadetes bacterium]|nr:acetylxylan esterase [Armatimonadota bacterium]
MLYGASALGLVLLLARPINYDETVVPDYTLPDPLVTADGRRVESEREWTSGRRAEVLDLFQRHVYGRTPLPPSPIIYEVFDQDTAALDGLATRTQVTIWLLGRRDGPAVDLLVYRPNHVEGRAPAFLGLNFGGNHTIADDPAIRITTAYQRDANADNGEAARGRSARRWPLELILKRGYALATAYYGEIEPDHAEGWRTSLRAAMSPDGDATAWHEGEWGAIGAWAFGLSRCLDYLVTRDDLDPQRVSVIGHSRLGKTSLWAGAQDGRFAMVVSNNSGEGGAAITRREYGETIATIVNAFPHWFTKTFNNYADREGDLPVDFHELIALVAPRPCYIASASEDRWADPKGEFLAGVGAEPVYQLFGLTGLGTDDWPAADTPVGERIGYHMRTGPHDILAYDWEQYLNFADKHLR